MKAGMLILLLRCINTSQGQVHSAQEVLSTLGVSPVASLSVTEVSTLSSGLFAFLGVAALQAYGTWSLMQLSDAVAAVSCEVFKVGLSQSFFMTLTLCKERTLRRFSMMYTFRLSQSPTSQSTSTSAVLTEGR